MVTRSPEDLREQLSGVLVFAPTPFEPGTLALDLAGFRQNMEFLAAAGIRAVAVAGFVGEYSALGPQEYRSVVRTAREAFGADGLVVAGAGVGAGLAAEHAAAAEQAGADCVMLLPPYLVQPSDDGLVGYTAGVARATRCGVMVHSMPSYPFSPDLVERLADVPGVVAYKDELGDVGNFRRVAARVGDRLAYVNGRAEPVMADYFDAGATVLATAIGNFDPELALSAYAALTQDGPGALAAVLAPRAMPWYELRQRERAFLISVSKASMSFTGLSGGAVRPPLSELTGVVQDELVQLMHTLGYLERQKVTR
jgi:5-dehydro-4-deoxyglucarate dehydratase